MPRKGIPLPLLDDRYVNVPGDTMTGDLSVPHLVLPEQLADTAAPVDSLQLHSHDSQGISVLHCSDSGGFTYELSQDSYFVGRNTTLAQINKGQIVYVSGATGSTPNIALSRSDSLTTLHPSAVAAENIPVNGFGRCYIAGVIENIDTSAFNVGDRLYASPTIAGSFTATKPTYPNYSKKIATVIVKGVGNGKILIRVAATLGQDVSDVIDHNLLANLTVGDVHTQYALLAGRATPQTFAFGNQASASTGYITSTSHATKGKYFLNAAGTITLDELNTRLGINTASPESFLHITGLDDGTTNADFRLRKFSSTGGVAAFFGERAGGTSASPSATPSGKGMFFLGGRGLHTDTGSPVWSSALTGVIQCISAEAFTSTAQGTILTFATTPIGSVSRAEALRINTTQNILIGTTSELTNGGKLQVVGTTSTLIQAIIRAAASQSANIQEWQKSDGSIYESVGATGLHTFANGGGFPYGSMYMDDGAVTVTISVAGTYYEVGSGMLAGLTNNTTFQNTKEIKILTAGIYKVDWGMSVACATANQHIEGAVMVNTTANAQTAGQIHLTTANDDKHISGTGIISLAANDVVKLCVENESGTNNIIVDHANLSLVMVGS